MYKQQTINNNKLCIFSMNWMTSHITDRHVSRDAFLFFGNRMGEASFEMMLHWTPLSMTWWTHYVMNSNRQKKIFFPKQRWPFTSLHIVPLDDNYFCENELKRYGTIFPTTFDSWKLFQAIPTTFDSWKLFPAVSSTQ